jgi:hypothetical protein
MVGESDQVKEVEGVDCFIACVVVSMGDDMESLILAQIQILVSTADTRPLSSP